MSALRRTSSLRMARSSSRTSAVCTTPSLFFRNNCAAAARRSPRTLTKLWTMRIFSMSSLYIAGCCGRFSLEKSAGRPSPNSAEASLSHQTSWLLPRCCNIVSNLSVLSYLNWHKWLRKRTIAHAEAEGFSSSFDSERSEGYSRSMMRLMSELRMRRLMNEIQISGITTKSKSLKSMSKKIVFRR